MAWFLLRRAGHALVVLLVVALLAFVLFRYAGDPLTFLVGPEVPAEERARVRAELGLDDALPVQFLRFVGHVARGQFGISYQLSRPVVEVIAVRLPATLELAFAASVFALGCGIPMGVFAALRPRSTLARVFMLVSLLGISLPSFFLGVILIYWLSVGLQLFPSFGRGTVTPIGGWWTTGLLTWEGLRAIVLPTVTLGLFQLAFVIRLVRAEMLDVLRSDFVRFARARGLRARAINFGHALRNALIPVTTIAGLHLGNLLGGVVVVETVFSWPGTGRLALEAVVGRDFNVLLGVLLLSSLLVIVVNMAIDLLHAWLDPRIEAH